MDMFVSLMISVAFAAAATAQVMNGVLESSVIVPLDAATNSNAYSAHCSSAPVIGIVRGLIPPISH